MRATAINDGISGQGAAFKSGFCWTAVNQRASDSEPKSDSRSA